MANPAIISATKNNAAIAAANTAATVSSTGNVTAGNIMVVAIEVAGAIAPTGITAPDGTWTTFLATTTTESSGLVSAAIFYKRATATGAFSGSFSWTTASTGGEWSFMEWAGAGAGIVDGTVGTTLNASSTSPTSPSKTPAVGTVNDTLVCMIFGGVLSTSTVAIPAGMTSILTVNGSATQTLFGAASLNLASASATSAETWTLGTGQAVLGASFLLQAGPDLNLHFVGHHKAAQHTVQPGLRFSSIDSSQSGPTAVVSIVNNAFVMTYNVPRAPIETSYNLYFRGDTSQSGPLPVQPETQPHFIARPWPVSFQVLPALRGNISADVSGPLPPQPEAQPHFLGRFTAPIFRRFGYNLMPEDVSSAAFETNTHFLARFVAPAFSILPALRMNISADVSGPLSAQPHTPQNFLTRFSAPAFKRPSYAGNATDLPAAAVVVNAINNAFVMTYSVPSAPVATRYLYHFGQATDVPAIGIQTAANPHFVPRYWNPENTVLMSLWTGDASDLPPPSADTPSNFIGRFTAPTFSRLPSLSWATDVSGPLPVQPLTNPHFIARPWPVAFRVLPMLRQNVPLDPVVAAQPETNVNFLGRFVPTHHAVLQLLRQNVAADTSTATVQPETQPHFLGRFTQLAFSRFAYNLTPEDLSGFVQPETNVHFIGRFSAPQHVVISALRSNVAADQSTAQPQSSTPVHTIGRFTQPQHFVSRALFENSPNDVPVPIQPETNTHFLGRFTPPGHFVLPALRLAPARDVVPETQPHYVPRTWPVAFNRRPIISTDTSRSSPVVQPETNVHTIGRFHQPAFSTFRYNYAGSDFSQVIPAVETNPHFLGRFTDPQFSRVVRILALQSAAPSPPYPDRAIGTDAASYLALASDV